MIKREFWIQKIEEAWTEKSVIWLAGVRRTGKTTICENLDGITYYDCEFPDVQKLLDEPRIFLTSMKGKRVALDEIHNLENPSRILKLAADHFPDVQIIATGSSTLNATKKFKDSLTDRHVLINLTPMLFSEGALFGNPSLEHRLLFGGLPPFFLKEDLKKVRFNRWLANFWANDISELFDVDKRDPFLTFTKLLLAQSSSSFEATRFAAACGVHRTTIASYLSILETTYAVDVIKPYSKHAATEIISAPKVFGFDTGFICYARGWHTLRPTDYGPLWEHIVLNELKGQLQDDIELRYWRTKGKNAHEVDFVVLKNRNHNPIAVECKWSYRSFDPENFKVFRARYKEGKNYVVCANIEHSFEREYDDIKIAFVSLEKLIEDLKD